MAALTLAQANRIIEAVLERGVALGCRPLAVIVVEPGCKVKAFQKEDGASMIRFEMAFGKAYSALALGRSSKLVRIRNEAPISIQWFTEAFLNPPPSVLDIPRPGKPMSSLPPACRTVAKAPDAGTSAKEAGVAH